MKVPKMYKSSDRYNAGTDVIYDDDSKLQYAPFVYATNAQSGGGDGGDDGGDEEGEEVMLVIYDIDTDTIDKSYKEIKEAVASGKVVMLTRIPSDSELVFIENVFYLTDITHQNPDSYVVTFSSSFYDDLTQNNVLSILVFEATTDTGTLEKVYPMPH